MTIDKTTTHDKQDAAGVQVEPIVMFDKKRETPEILWSAARQYQHNDCSGLLIGFDYDETLKLLRNEIEKAHMYGQADALVGPSYSNAQNYCNKLLET